MAKKTRSGAKRPAAKKQDQRSGSAAKTSAKAGAKKGPARPAAQPTRQQKEARALRNRLIAGGVLIVLAGVVVFFAARPAGGPSVSERLEAGPGSCNYDRDFDGTASNQSQHIPSPTYEVDPPAGGAHTPTAANPSFYREGQVPPDGQLVHAMEHGFVVLWYSPDLPAEKITELEQLSDQHGRELILAPRSTLAGEVAVTAWHRRLLCAELVPDKVSLFTRSYKDQGPEKGFL